MKNVDRLARGMKAARDSAAAEADEHLLRRCVERGLLTDATADDVRDRLRELELEGRAVTAERLLRERGDVAPGALDDITRIESGPPASDGIPPGTSLGRYRVSREIARGGMGVVYEGEDLELHRRVALKVLRERHVDPLVIQRLHREAAIAAQLQHPNIVSIHEVGMVRGPDGQPLHFICMDFVDGQTLAALLAQRTAREELLRILELVARAVAYAHERGVIHRDLKPSNVLVERDGRVVLTDFGLARSEGFQTQLTHTQAVMGTPNYMAPEQVRGDTRGLGPHTDVWALGVMLYEITTGRHPFIGGSVLEIYDRIIRDEPTNPRKIDRGVSSDLEIVCMKALEKEPARRYPQAGAFAEDVARARQGEPISAKPAPLLRRLGRRLSRRAMSVGVVVGALAAVAITAAIVIPWQARREFVQRMKTEQLQLSDAIRAARPLFYVSGSRDFREKMEEVERALKRLDELAEVPALAGEPGLWTSLGAGWYFLGNASRAEACLLRAGRLKPENDEADYYLARMYLDRWMTEKVLGSRIERGVPLDPKGDWSRKVADLLDRSRAPSLAVGTLDRQVLEACREITAGRQEEAFKRCDEGRRRFKDSIGREDFLLLMAVLVKGEMRKGLLAEALAVKPHFAMAHLIVGVDRQALDDLPGAVAAYDAAITVNPHLVAAYINRSGVKVTQGKARECIDDATRAIELGSDSPYPYVNRGSAYLDLGELDNAIKSYDEALKIDPDRWEALGGRGSAKERKGDREGALQDYMRAVEASKGGPHPLVYRGKLLRDMGRLDEAIRDLDSALRQIPDWPAAILARGLALHRKGDFDGAMRDFNDVVRLAPAAGEGYLRRGLLRIDRREFDVALEDLDTAIGLEPGTFLAHMSRGLVRLMLGNPTGAIEDADEAIRLHSAHPEPHYIKGRAFMALGQPDQALASLRAAAGIAPPAWERLDETQKLIGDLSSH